MEKKRGKKGEERTKKEERGIKSYLITIRINQRKLRPAKTSTLIALFPTRFISSNRNNIPIVLCGFKNLLFDVRLIGGGGDERSIYYLYASSN